MDDSEERWDFLAISRLILFIGYYAELVNFPIFVYCDAKCIISLRLRVQFIVVFMNYLLGAVRILRGATCIRKIDGDYLGDVVEWSRYRFYTTYEIHSQRKSNPFFFVSFRIVEEVEALQAILMDEVSVKNNEKYVFCYLVRVQQALIYSFYVFFDPIGVSLKLLNQL